RCCDIVFVELPLSDVAVVALEFLLGLQLRAKIRQLLGAALSMLTWPVGPLVHGALGSAPEVLAHPAIEFVFGSRALAHSASNSTENRDFRGLTPRKGGQYSHGLLPVKLAFSGTGPVAEPVDATDLKSATFQIFLLLSVY